MAFIVFWLTDAFQLKECTFFAIYGLMRDARLLLCVRKYEKSHTHTHTRLHFFLYSIQESDSNDARESNICTYKIAWASNLQHSLKARHYQYAKSYRISRIKHLRSKRETEWGVTVRARATSFARPTFVFTFSLIQKQNVLVHTMHLTVGHYWLRLHSFPFATNVTLQYSPSR